MAVVGRAEVKIVADARGFSRQAERAVNRELQRVDVDADPIRNGIAQGLVGAGVQRAVSRGATRSAAGWLNQFGRILQGGISTRAAGFIGAGALAAIIPVMTVVGTLAGGALVTAFGAAIAAIPLIVAAQNETVQASFAGAFRRIGNTLRQISQPFISTWISIMGTMTDTFEAFVLPLERAFAILGGPAGPIAQFVNHLGEAFEEMVVAIVPITRAFVQILDDLGPELIRFFDNLAAAMITLSNEIASGDAFINLLGWLFDVITGTIEFLAVLTNLGNWFADNWQTISLILDPLGEMFALLGALTVSVFGLVDAIVSQDEFMRILTTNLRIFVTVLSIVVLAVVAVIDRIAQWIRDTDVLVQDIETATGAIGRFFTAMGRVIGNALGAIGRFFIGMGRTVASVFSSMVGNVRSGVRTLGRFWDNLRSSTGRMLSSIRSGFNSFVGFIRSIPGRVGGALRNVFSGLWEGFRSAANRVVDGWNRLSLTLGGGSYDPLGVFGPTISVPSFTISTPNIPRLQRGGLIERAGIAEVGEAGRETVFLPQGAQVDPRPVDRIVAESQRLPDEFEATAIIDLGNDIQRAVQLTFRRVATNARAGQRRTAAMS